MSQNEADKLGLNRRDFIRGGSVATLMTMLGGVELISGAATPSASDIKFSGPPLKVGIIGLGGWGRELLTALLTTESAEVTAICDNYPAFLKRAGTAAPKATQVADYKAILENKEIKGVFVATPTHQHKDIVLAALKAGKHVYCEAPLANTIEDAKAIALAAKAASKSQIFQAGLQLRCEPHRHFLLPFVRSGAIGTPVSVRAQWHKKQSWRATSPNPEREKTLNWRLDKNLSTGLMGEIGVHHIDQVGWFLNSMPTAVTGFGAVRHWQDGREVPDTIQAMFEYANDVVFNFDATLANSFDASYELFHGSDSAVMIRDNKAWMFKEVDAPMLGWEVYAKKENFYKETGISLMIGASKSVPAAVAAAENPENDTLKSALVAFTRNAVDIESAMADSQDLFKDDPNGLAEYLAKEIKRRPAAGFLEAYKATILGIKANEAVLARKRIEIDRALYELA